MFNDALPLVEDEERGIIREGAITRGLRRRQVEDYDEETAPKQARLRDISDHHLYRKRMFASAVDETSNQVALVHNAAVVSTHKHVVEILKLQNFEGAYFKALDQAQRDNLKLAVETPEVEGMFSDCTTVLIINNLFRHGKT